MGTYKLTDKEHSNIDAIKAAYWRLYPIGHIKSEKISFESSHLGNVVFFIFQGLVDGKQEYSTFEMDIADYDNI